MIYLNKYEQCEYWLNSSTGDVYACEETGDGLVWYDARGWDVTFETFCEKLANARADALAKMPKRVEYKSELIEYSVDGTLGLIDYGIPTNILVAELLIKAGFKKRNKVKVIIEEVQE